MKHLLFPPSPVLFFFRRLGSLFGCGKGRWRRPVRSHGVCGVCVCVKSVRQQFTRFILYHLQVFPMAVFCFPRAIDWRRRPTDSPGRCRRPSMWVSSIGPDRVSFYFIFLSFRRVRPLGSKLTGRDRKKRAPKEASKVSRCVGCVRCQQSSVYRCHYSPCATRLPVITRDPRAMRRPSACNINNNRCAEASGPLDNGVSFSWENICVPFFVVVVLIIILFGRIFIASLVNIHRVRLRLRIVPCFSAQRPDPFLFQPVMPLMIFRFFHIHQVSPKESMNR